jgi:hypothetical protein
MRRVFSSNNVSEMVLVRDALRSGGVPVSVQNELSSQSAVPGFRPPAEIWIEDDALYTRAKRIVVSTLAVLDSKSPGDPWKCPHCSEENPQSFELCWNCGHDR